MKLFLERDPLVAWKMPLSPHSLRRALESMLRACGHAGIARAEVEVSLVGDAVMEAANRRFLGCPGPTNVLSFPAADARSPLALMLNLDAVERECLLYGQAAGEHLLRLLAHGLVHALGHDHGPAMESLCARACAAVREV